jgi:hypothetical protein
MRDGVGESRFGSGEGVDVLSKLAPPKASLRGGTGELAGPETGHMLATNALLRNVTALMDMLVLR